MRSRIATSSSCANGLEEDLVVIKSNGPIRIWCGYFTKGCMGLCIIQHASKVFEYSFWKDTIVGVVFTMCPRFHVICDILELGSVPE